MTRSSFKDRIDNATIALRRRGFRASHSRLPELSKETEMDMSLLDIAEAD
jgi:hypothetical protein